MFNDREIRVFFENDDIWLPVSDIAITLGLARNHFYEAIHRNEEVFEGYSRLVKVTLPSQTAGLNKSLLCVNEQGCYILLGKVNISRIKDEGKRRAVIGFQRWVGEVVKTYRMNLIKKVLPLTDRPDVVATLETQLQITDLLVRYAGVDRGIAGAVAIANTEDLTGASLHPYKALLRSTGLPSYILLNATQIGQRLGSVGARDVNRILAQMGFIRQVNQKWEVLPAGKQFSDSRPFTAVSKTGAKHSDVQILWKPEIVDEIKKYQIVQTGFSKGLITGYI